MANNSAQILLRTSYRTSIPENQEELDTLTPGLVYFLLLLNGLTGVFGTLGNILTILIVCISKRLQTVPNMFVAHLAGIDTIVCGIILPMSMRTHITDKYGAPSACKVFGPMNISVMLLSMMSMANIAVNRYILVCKPPYMYSMIYTKRNIVLIYIVSYVYVGLMIIPPFFGLGVWTANVKYKACMFSAYDFNSYLYVNVFLNGLALMPAIGLNVTCYYCILKKFRNVRFELQKSVRQSRTMELRRHKDSLPKGRSRGLRRSSGNSQTLDTAVVNKTSSDTKKYRTILGMMVVFIVFITFWTPLSIAGFADFNGRLPADYFVAAWSFAMLNSCLNTFVYAWLNQKFRRAYKLLLSRKWRQLQTDSLNNVSFSTA